MRAIYLHGFASGPESRKARFFKDRLETAGVEVQVPELEEGDFENLTISSQLRVVDEVVGKGPVRLVGSSMGGYLAALFAAMRPKSVEKLVLLAPAFGFADRWPKVMGEGAVNHWLTTGKLPVFHYSEGKQRDLGVGMYEDSKNWEGEPEFSQPAMIFHGVRDAVVPVEASREFARSRSHVQLVELDSDHALLDVLPDIWTGAEKFLLG